MGIPGSERDPCAVRHFDLGSAADHHEGLFLLGVEVPGIYWHFVDIMWIIVFATIYIL